MYKVIKGNTKAADDVLDFIKLVDRSRPELHDHFDRESDIFVTRAPGRLDIMGGIADYSGSLVLEMPIKEATFAAIQASNDTKIRIVSLQPGTTDFLEFEMGVEDLAASEDELYYDNAKSFFVRDPRNHWASYVAGAFFVLRREIGLEFTNGVRIFIGSSVPVGKGVSSSAALEVATMHAVSCAYDLNLDAREIAILCQKVENHIVGAPCGVMDQISVSCGIENCLLSLLCQPAEIQGTINIPDEMEFWGIDSGVRHSVAGADYSSVRTGAFMGYRIITQSAGFEYEQIDHGLVKVNDDRWRGYLANITPEEYEGEFASIVPDEISNEEFLMKYGGLTDLVSTIDRAGSYKVRGPTEHAIYESSRVKKFANVLREGITENSLKMLGELMFESHESYSVCGLTEPCTDRIVELVRKNRSQGFYGARITGGGSGGTVAILARRDSLSAIENISGQIRLETGTRPYIFHGSSPGAARFDHIRLRAV